MKIIAGQLKGRTLYHFDHSFIQPTKNFVKEALFNIIQNHQQKNTAKKYFLDLFSGTGSIGFEAFSRGFKHVTCIEKNMKACHLIERNKKKLRLSSFDQIFDYQTVDATNLYFSAHQYDYIFMDPPYGKGLAEKVLFQLIEKNWLKKDSLIIVEENLSWKDAIISEKLILLEKRVYGKTALYLLEKREETIPFV